MKIYHNPRCSKSRQTLEIIQQKTKDIEIVDYLTNVPTAIELTKLVRLLKIKPEGLVRKGEDIFKEKYKGKILSDEQWINAMIENPKLIERPIVINGNKAVIGRPPEKVLELF